MQVKCSNCGIEIRWQPTIVDGEAYCCWGCTQGGPCTCDYSNLPRSTDRVALACVMVAREEVCLFQDHQHGREV
jgi:hypothetical protein